jgi:hypothetical protein
MNAPDSIFVPTIASVRRAIRELVEARANPVTPGYLCVLEAATKAGRMNDLRPRFRLFFDRYLRIAEAPEKKPYLVPFGRTGTGEALLFNQNVAGSYAPSSIRDVNPLYDVLEISAAGTYTLLGGHAEAVRERILPRALPFCATACFLYRDYGFASVPTPDDLLDQLNEDFGFALGQDLLASGVFMDDRAFGLADFAPLSVQ